MSKNKVAIHRYVVLYVHSTYGGKYSKCRIFTDYETALKCYSRGCNYIDSDYDGYNYVALLCDCDDCNGYRTIAWRDNLGDSWDIEDYVNG